MSKNTELSPEFLLYQTEDGQTRIEVRLTDETVWLCLTQMSELFGRDKSVISRHVRNVYEEGELPRAGTVANIATVQSEGERAVEFDCSVQLHRAIAPEVAVGAGKAHDAGSVEGRAGLE